MFQLKKIGEHRLNSTQLNSTQLNSTQLAKFRGFFPQRNLLGFTLIELLVVISIIAILSVIGMAVFTNVQKSTRDARRMSDINTITTALEVNKSVSYLGIAPTWFASGAIPYDPKTSGPGDASVVGCGNPAATDGYGNKCWYCYNISDIIPNFCDGPDGFISTSDTGLNNSTKWKVCANLENSPGFYCKANSQ